MARKREEKKHRGVYEKVPGSGVWWVRYWGDGKIKREKVGSKSAAITLYQKRKTQIREGEKLPANMRFRGEKLGVIIDRAIAWYEEHRPRSVRTARTHLETVKEALGNRLADDLKPQDVDTWLAAHTDWTQATKNRYKATLGRALQLALENGHLQRNVARLVIARKEHNTRERYLSPDEETRIVEVINETCPSYLPAFIIALQTGMRQSEQFGLTWNRVDFKVQKIRLAVTKSGKPHTVPMNDTCLQAFETLFAARPKGCTTERVFLSVRYQCQPLENPRQWFPDVLAAAKVKDFRWHDIRHTCASRLVQRGVSLQTVCKLLNHGSIATTMRYAHLATTQLEEAVALIG